MKFADLKKQKFNWNSIVDFCRKNIRYISAGIIVVLLVIVLAVTNAKPTTDGEMASDGQTQDVDSQKDDENPPTEEFEVDALPEINTLIENYYTAYAAGDVAALETYATPISDLEKSYIGVFSQFVSGYEDIKCNTKSGLGEGEYAVSVLFEMRFEGAETTAPGLDFFYVRTNEDGAFYIDNLYSQFNLANRELELDSQVDAFIEAYGEQADVQALQNDVQQRYDAALANDAALNTIAMENLPQALRTWSASVISPTDGGQTSTGDTAQVQPEQTEPAPEETNTDDPAVETNRETIYVTDNVNIRQEPSEDAERIGRADEGESFTRISTTDNGWSEIEYQGGSAYIKSDYVSTQAPGGVNAGVNYIPEGKTLTASGAYNVRASMNENAERLGTTSTGDTIKVVMSYEEGWTKVEWNDKSGYIRTDLLLNN